jgi:hypothetical protein
MAFWCSAVLDGTRATTLVRGKACVSGARQHRAKLARTAEVRARIKASPLTKTPLL